MKYTLFAEESETYSDPFKMKVEFHASHIDEVLMHLTLFLKGVGFVCLDNKTLEAVSYETENSSEDEFKPPF